MGVTGGRSCCWLEAIRGLVAIAMADFLAKLCDNVETVDGLSKLLQEQGIVTPWVSMLSQREDR